MANINKKEKNTQDMVLDNQEKAIAMITNALVVYSIRTENGKTPESESMIDFILKSMPADIKPEATIQLIDEVFEYVSQSHLQLS